MNNSLSSFLITAAIVLGVLLIFLIIVGWLVIRQLRRFVSPNTARLQQQLDRLRAANPTVSVDSLMQQIIRQQARKCGLVGALTGLGGFVTFPIALPIDLILSSRIQATLVQFIAITYGHAPATGVGLSLQTRLISTGSIEVSETAFNFTMKVIVRLIGESLSILIPAISAVVGFIVNYAIAQTSGQLALRWYSSLMSGITPERNLAG